MLPALLKTLWEAKIEYSGVGTGAEGAKKVEKATSLLNRIHNAQFLLSLSALVDIYSVYSNIANLLQIVDLLVFERLDLFDLQLEKMQELANTVSVETCPCNDYYDYSTYNFRAPGLVGTPLENLIKERCGWSVYHGDMREMMMEATYRGVVVGNFVKESNKTRAGRIQAERVENTIKEVEAVCESTIKGRAVNVAEFLHKGLSRVFTGTERSQIESIRVVLNLEFYCRAVVRSGYANTATVHFRRWTDSAKLLQPDLLHWISLEELRMQFRCFLMKLEELTPTVLAKNQDNKQIFSLLLHPEYRHYFGFESVLSVMSNAAVSMGLESVVESWVSVMEHHNNPNRALSQDR